MKETRRTRQIRMLDSEWDAFKRLLGTEWLRKQIERKMKQAEKGEAK